MEQKTVDREKLTDYLLGKLSGEEQDAMAEQYFTDDDLFDRLLEVKTDLMDQYARGLLPTADRRRFENYLDKLPDGWREVAVARAMVGIIDKEDAAPAETIQPAAYSEPTSEPTSELIGLRQRLAAWVTQLAPVMVMVMGMGIIALGGALIWAIIRGQQLSLDAGQLIAQTRQREARRENLERDLEEAERKIASEERLTAQLQQELQIEKHLREAQSPLLALPLIAWPLSYSAVRDPGQPVETVRLDRRAKTVALIIPVKEKQKLTGYEVELKTEDGKQILWWDNWPDTPPPGAGRNIVFHRPASQFDETSYKLTLTLISPGEKKTRDYYFTVVRK